MDIQHKCTVWDYCFLDNDENYKILFCVFCRKVVGYDKDGKRVILDHKEKQYTKNEYSPETLNDSV